MISYSGKPVRCNELSISCAAPNGRKGSGAALRTGYQVYDLLDQVNDLSLGESVAR